MDNLTESPGGIWRVGVPSKSTPGTRTSESVDEKPNTESVEKLKPERVDDPTPSVSPGSTSSKSYKSKPGTSCSEAVDKKPKMGPHYQSLQELVHLSHQMRKYSLTQKK